MTVRGCRGEMMDEGKVEQVKETRRANTGAGKQANMRDAMRKSGRSVIRVYPLFFSMLCLQSTKRMQLLTPFALNAASNGCTFVGGGVGRCGWLREMVEWFD